MSANIGMMHDTHRRTHTRTLTLPRSHIGKTIESGFNNIVKSFDSWLRTAAFLSRHSVHTEERIARAEYQNL